MIMEIQELEGVQKKMFSSGGPTLKKIKKNQWLQITSVKFNAVILLKK